jgi:rhomboid family GlyGly-CTERM serine protease
MRSRVRAVDAPVGPAALVRPSDSTSTSILSAGRLAWLLVALLLALPALAVWPQHVLALPVLGWTAAVPWAEPWRWWSAAWPHLSLAHLLANLAGWSIVLAFGWVADLPRRAAWAWALAWPLTHVALLGQPGLALYAGMSGVLHAGVAVAAYAVWRRALAREAGLALAVLAGLALKVALEWWADPAQPGALHLVASVGLTTVPRAHLSGMLTGLACAALICRAGPASPR